MSAHYPQDAKREQCWRPLCIIGFSPCEPRWFGDELWAACAVCGKKRVFLPTSRTPKDDVREALQDAQRDAP